MSKINDVAAKLRLIGASVQFTSNTSFICKEQLKDTIDCYRTDKDKIVCDKYDSIDRDMSNKYIIGVRHSNCILMSRELTPINIFYKEGIDGIILDKFIRLATNIRNTYRLIAINGEEIIPSITSKIHVHIINDDTIVIRAKLLNGQVRVIRASYSDKLTAELLIHAEYTDDIVVGTYRIAIKYRKDGKVKVFDLNGKTKLVVNNGNIEITDSMVKISDRYKSEVETFKLADIC